MCENKLKCGNCGTEGNESHFVNRSSGNKECPWCESDIWLLDLDEANEQN